MDFVCRDGACTVSTALISSASRCSRTDGNTWNIFQLVRTRFKCGTRGKHVVYEEDVLSL